MPQPVSMLFISILPVLTKLGDGFYASVNNQTIGQTKTVGNNYHYLTNTPRDYVGDVSAPIYPGVYVAYKKGKLAISAGFNPVGGGGGATYNTGLPSFEIPISDLKPLLTGMGLTYHPVYGRYLF